MPNEIQVAQNKPICSIQGMQQGTGRLELGGCSVSISGVGKEDYYCLMLGFWVKLWCDVLKQTELGSTLLNSFLILDTVNSFVTIMSYVHTLTALESV